MPRSARLDIPGLLQHVIVRGIERRDIFLDDEDRTRFLKRFSTLLVKTDTRCFAWALMSNHFHLLLMPTAVPLSCFMRRLLTGYAVVFNRKYSRSGHLFQNRYKSIVCEEEPYLLELVRYIHLNPLRAGLVSELAALDHYQWGGHAVLMGNCQLEGHATTEVLAHFGKGLPRARQNYRQFVADGIPAGRSEKFSGGGLMRSKQEGGDSFESFDERILGSGEFVDSLRQEETLRPRIGVPIGLPELVNHVSEKLQIDPEKVRRPSKTRHLAEARGVICYLAVRHLGYKGTEIGKELRLGPTGVSIAIRRGEKSIANFQDIVSWVMADR